MITVKTSELTGAALDWAVAICETPNVSNRLEKKRKPDLVTNFKPLTDWAQGGPIIERCEIDINRTGLSTWRAKTISLGRLYDGTGQTPLIAAMRCYVASKLGDVVEIPEELL